MSCIGSIFFCSGRKIDVSPRTKFSRQIIFFKHFYRLSNGWNIFYFDVKSNRTICSCIQDPLRWISREKNSCRETGTPVVVDRRRFGDLCASRRCANAAHLLQTQRGRLSSRSGRGNKGSSEQLFLIKVWVLFPAGSTTLSTWRASCSRLNWTPWRSLIWTTRSKNCADGEKSRLLRTWKCPSRIIWWRAFRWFHVQRKNDFFSDFTLIHARASPWHLSFCWSKLIVNWFLHLDNLADAKNSSVPQVVQKEIPLEWSWGEIVEKQEEERNEQDSLMYTHRWQCMYFN